MRTLYKRLLPSLRVLVVCLITGGAAMAQNTPAAKPPATKQDSSRGKASDTTAQAGDVLKRLEAIEKELQKVTAEMKRLQPNEAPSSKQLKALEDTLALSKRQNAELLKEKNGLVILSNQLKDELSRAKNSLDTAKKAAKEERGLLTKQLEAEITAVMGMGEEVPDALLESMLKRTTVLSPSNKEDFKKFKDHVALLRDARSVLKAAPDATRLPATLIELKATNMAAFPELEKDRQDVLKVLEKYCERSKNMAEQITNAAGLTSPEKRRSFLEDARYLTKESSYLKAELEKALADPAHRMPTPTCN
jgi:hypothetical protein